MTKSFGQLHSSLPSTTAAPLQNWSQYCLSSGCMVAALLPTLASCCSLSVVASPVEEAGAPAPAAVAVAAARKQQCVSAYLMRSALMFHHGDTSTYGSWPLSNQGEHRCTVQPYALHKVGETMPRAPLPCTAVHPLWLLLRAASTRPNATTA